MLAKTPMDVLAAAPPLPPRPPRRKPPRPSRRLRIVLPASTPPGLAAALRRALKAFGPAREDHP
jgi:hypothetical protein